MGSSGAGKTTLMDVIAGRKTGGQIRGQILLNGYPATDLTIRRATGYCEQMDIHSDASTFREALTFSAFLRQDADVPDSQKYDSVNECLELLDLHSIADQIIRGSSSEQMKRLTIGVELAAQPSVLFLDEPTSGLDARSAKLIMDGVRKVADTGRTIICTIHQPSALVFGVFDSLLLLKRGGEMVFFGDLGVDASKMVTYFESIEGVSKLEEGSNPATWMLEVIGAGVGNGAGNNMDFVALFKGSEQYRQLESHMTREGVTSLGITYLKTDYTSYQGVNSGLGMIYMGAVNMTFVAFTSILPIACKEPPYSFGTSLLFMVIFYPIVGFTGVSAFFTFWLNLSLIVLLMTYFGQLLAYLLPSLEVASVVMVLLNTICILFTGFNPPAASLPRGYVWLHKIIPHKYAFASLAAIVFGDCPADVDGKERGCRQMNDTPPSLPDGISVKEYLERNFLIEHDDIWFNVGILVAWIAGLQLLSLLVLRYVNHQTR
ncbi:hypothetical protein PHYBOEH_002535 [Phytophthora boehmeriae]|uniref:AAA+ ATPase domain-containing protein n=1 Tax=Phytophthora boehmeriae TaxID=109152 RepID=A0A8T1WVL4_9STRA|nr:hypothetical protein PHYBOEH_002535 [Phytophthora boehmeriae]